MHGVPVDIDLSAFVGATLTQICLGENQVQFNFTPRDPFATTPSPYIHSEGRWDLRTASGEVIDAALGDDELPQSRDVYRIHRALGRDVLEYRVQAPTSISLVLTDGLVLTVYDDETGYEAFHVMPGEYHI